CEASGDRRYARLRGLEGGIGVFHSRSPIVAALSLGPGKVRTLENARKHRAKDRLRLLGSRVRPASRDMMPCGWLVRTQSALHLRPKIGASLVTRVPPTPLACGSARLAPLFCRSH